MVSRVYGQKISAFTRSLLHTGTGKLAVVPTRYTIEHKNVLEFCPELETTCASSASLELTTVDHHFGTPVGLVRKYSELY